jgi:hypothetical protein
MRPNGVMTPGLRNAPQRDPFRGIPRQSGRGRTKSLRRDQPLKWRRVLFPARRHLESRQAQNAFAGFSESPGAIMLKIERQGQRVLACMALCARLVLVM